MTTSSVKKVRIRIGPATREITLNPPKHGFNALDPLISALPHEREIVLENGARIKLRPKRGVVKTRDHGDLTIDATEISAEMEGRKVVLVSDGRDVLQKGITHKLVRVTHGPEQVFVKPVAAYPVHEDIVRAAQIQVPFSQVKRHVRGCMVEVRTREIIVSGESADYGPTIKAEVAQTIGKIFGAFEIGVKVVYDASVSSLGHAIEKMRAQEE